MFSFFIRKIFGSKNDRYLKSLSPILNQINALESTMKALSDKELPVQLSIFKQQLQEGKRTIDELLPEVFALVRETSSRVLGMRHFDVQLIGGISLHRGKIAEMKTGEGKTLMATLPVVLNALEGKGVHVVTVNDYLAQRDAEWMGALYSALGLTTGVLTSGLSDDARKEAYAADITYGTNNEFGFDFLRDNMKFYPNQLVQRGHFFAIIDEVDSILIDEARTPLIISGGSEQSTTMYTQIDKIVRNLKPQQDFSIDEKGKVVILSDEGAVQVEKALGIDNMYDPSNIAIQHHVLQALKAHYIFRRDVDYIVKDDQVVIVDEFTGRLMPGRRFSDGLHQALEAKERVTVAAENQTLASITFQNYFRMYNKLAGMTGTADTEAVEFAQIYGLEVVVIPSNKPMIRKDYSDVIYRTRKEKFDAIVKAIIELHKKGQPVLVGTISVETSELISSMLRKKNISHNVLNAKHHAQEAEIIAQAGQVGKVTIATNMAGRGTDIVLGDRVVELGGLHILGTERHESRRIDNQLRGRAGRQGDPGSSRFYLSLEDDLMRLFGSDKLSGLMQRLGMEEGEPIENIMVSRAIESAQKRVEGHHFEIRKSLLDYDNVMNQQRTVIYTLRHDIMNDPEPMDIILEYLDELLSDIYIELEDNDNNELNKSIRTQLYDIMNLSQVMSIDNTLPTKEQAKALILSMFEKLKSKAGEAYNDLLRYVLLEELDRCWKDHLRNMDFLREGIGLRGYGQRDPKLEYKKEGFVLFQELLANIREGVFRTFTRLHLEKKEDNFFQHEPINDLWYPGSHEKETKLQVKKTDRVGRNDLCPCGSGKKYKKCCGVH